MPVYQEAGLAMSIPWSIAADPPTRRPGVVTVAASYPETAAHLARVSQTMGFSQMLELSDPAIPPIPDDMQALVLATDGVAAGEIILALEQAQVSLPRLGQVDVGSPQLLQVAKGAANGLIFASPGPAPRHVADAAAFVEAYQALAGFPPGPRAVLAYDATYVLLDAIAQTVRIINRPPTRSEVSAHIGSVQRRGLSGDISFDLQGQRRQAPVWVYQISDELYPGVLLTP
jgi:ABC-type branched-subunit amino acid transport system substrate-binding protein